MDSDQLRLGEKFIAGKMISLDEENIDKLDQMSKTLKQVETNLKENIISKFSQRR